MAIFAEDGSSDSALLVRLASANYILAGLVNAYLSTLWGRERFWLRVAALLLKPIVLVYLVLAVIAALLFVFAFWVVGLGPGSQP